MRLMNAVFAGRCPTCGLAVAKGESIMFDGNAAKGHKAKHATCAGRDLPPAPAPTPAAAPSRTAPPAWTVPECSPPARLANRVSVDQCWFARHDTMASLIDLPKSTRKEAEIVQAYAKPWQSDRNTESWLGIAGGQAAVAKVLREGWQAGAERLSTMASAAVSASAAVTIRRVLTRGDHGDEFDIHAAMRGSFDKAWTRRTRGARLSSPTVSLAAVVGAHAGCTGEQLFWRGAALARLADLLCEAGYRVSITGIAAGCAWRPGSTRDRCIFAHTFPIKATDQPLDLSAVAVAVCLAGFMRTVVFNATGCHPTKTGTPEGIASDISSVPSDYLPAVLADHGHPDAIFVPAHVMSQAAAETWIKATVEKIAAGQAEALPEAA